MQRIEKTVFISYRRTNVPWALAIYQHLTHQGFDVFFDYQSIASGDFEQVILESIKARVHFLVLLTPSALERCGDPGDWLRREIETALATQRNIVPLMFEGFDFATPALAQHLTGNLAELKRYNALRVLAEYFDEAMARLREKYLNVPLDAVKHPLSLNAQQVVKTQQAAANIAPVVKEKELTAQEWFEKGYKVNGPNEKIHCYSEAIRLDPDSADAYNNRGAVRRAKGDLDAAVKDFTEAIRLSPDHADAYYNRGIARYAKGDLDAAHKDHTEAIRLRRNYANAYVGRGNVNHVKGDLDAALKDYTEAIRLSPGYANAYAYISRGVAYSDKGDLDAALKDCTEAIRLSPDHPTAYYNRGAVRRAKGDLDAAVKDFTEAIRLRSDYANAYYNRAGVLEQKLDHAAAIADLQKYLDLGGGIRSGNQAAVEKMIADIAALMRVG